MILVVILKVESICSLCTIPKPNSCHYLNPLLGSPAVFLPHPLQDAGRKLYEKQHPTNQRDISAEMKFIAVFALLALFASAVANESFDEHLAERKVVPPLVCPCKCFNFGKPFLRKKFPRKQCRFKFRGCIVSKCKKRFRRGYWCCVPLNRHPRLLLPYRLLPQLLLRPP